MRELFNDLSDISRAFFDFLFYQRRDKFLYRLAIGPKMFGYFDTGFPYQKILAPVLHDGAAPCCGACSYSFVHFAFPPSADGGTPYGCLFYLGVLVAFVPAFVNLNWIL